MRQNVKIFCEAITIIVICLGTFLGLLGWTQSVMEVTPKDGVDFMWQIVLFGFVIGVGLISIKPESVDNKIFRDAGIGVMLASVLMIIGYGVAYSGIKFLNQPFIVTAGIYVFFDGGVLILSACIAFASLELLKIVAPRLKQIFI